MATHKASICPNCKHIILNAKEICPICEQKLSGYYIGNPFPKQLYMESKEPNLDEITVLLDEPFSRVPPSAAEIRKAIILLAIGVICSPLMLLFGIWVSRAFRGPGVLFYGYLPIIAAPIILIIFLIWSFNILLRDGRKKKPEASFAWLWHEAYFAEVFISSGRYESINYACGTAARSVPKSLSSVENRELLGGYIENIRSIVDTILDTEGAKVDTSCYAKNGSQFSASWNGESIQVVTNVSSQQELSDVLRKINGTVTITKSLTCQIGSGNNSDTYQLPVSSVELNIVAWYIKHRAYWFPFDMMPVVVESGNTVINQQHLSIEQAAIEAYVEDFNICQSCGASITQSDKFCITCGMPVTISSPITFCPGCGLQLSDDAHFCVACGEKLPTSINTIPSKPAE